MNLLKIILLVLTLGCPCALATPAQSSALSTIHHVAQSGPAINPVLGASWFKWLDELINGARSTRHVPGQAYRFTQQEDRRGGEHGWLYYLALGIWRLAAAAGAAAIAGKAIEKQTVSARTKNVVFIAPFIVGLIWPLVALFGAGVVWMASKEGSNDEPSSKG